MPMSDEDIAKHSFTIPAKEPQAISYVNIHADTGNTRILDSFGFAIKKLTTAMQDARHVNTENILSQVKIVHTMATAIKIGNHIIPLRFVRSRLTNMISRSAAITHTTAPEKAPKKA